MRHLNTYQQQILNKKLFEYSSKMSALQQMRELISKGADVNYQNKSGKTPLMEATRKQFYSGVKLLIDKHANVNTADENGYTALTIIIAMSISYNFNKYVNFKKIIDLLIESGAKLDVKSEILDNINYTHIVDYISDKYPEQYEEYLLKKTSEKYNI